MPIDWSTFDKQIDDIVKSAADRTDERLASRISSITRMTDEEVVELFPKPGDAQKVAQLMKIVRSAKDQNRKVNEIVENAEKFGGVILTLLQKFV